MICVDASVAAKWVLPEEWAEQARALYVDALVAREPIVAPALLPIEVTNILFKRTRGPGGLSVAEAAEQLDNFLGFSFEIHHPAGLHRRALQLAHHYELPAAYDAHYLALAELFGCAFWTNDQRLLRAVGIRLPFVRPISEYGAP